MPPQPHIAIAILNYNGKNFLAEYLPSVLQTTYGNKSVWVIDNRSSDDSTAFLAANYPQVNVVINSGNLGFAAGYNEGLQKIQAEYYLLLNSDVQVPPGFIEPVLALMEEDRSIAFAQPKMRWLRQPALFEYAGAAGGLMDSLGYPFCRGRILSTLETDEGQYNDHMQVFWASGACMFARAATYHELGGMYPFFFMHNEEIDLCWRAQNEGYKVIACGNSEVFHLGAGSLTQDNPRKTFYNFRNNYIMNARNMGIGRLLWLLPVRMCMDTAAAGMLVAGGQAKAGFQVFRAMLAFWGWLLLNKNKLLPRKRGLLNVKGVYRGSVLLAYYVRGIKKYSGLKKTPRS